MKIDPCSPRWRGPWALCSDVKCCQSVFSFREGQSSPVSRVVLTLGELATSKWLIIGEFQFVVKDCEIVRVLTWIKAFLMTQQFVLVCWMLVFSPLISLTRRARILFWVTTLSYAVTSQARGWGSGPANQEISDVHQDISTAGAEGICSSRAQGSLANQKLTPLTSRPSLVLNEI